jgi:hypothetical protein
VGPVPITEEEIQAMAVLGSIVWSLVAVRVARMTELDERERHALGSAMVPVFRKYSNLLGGFEAEFTLLVVAGGLVLSHLPEPKSEASSATVIEDDKRRR